MTDTESMLEESGSDESAVSGGLGCMFVCIGISILILTIAYVTGCVP